MGQLDERCCGDHPGDWDRPAVPGTGWCAECLAQLRNATVRDPAVYEQDPDAEAYLFAEPEIDRPRRRGYK